MTMKKYKQILSGLFVLLVMTGCRKVTYNAVSNPAYLRVFNSLNYPTTLENKDNPPPFLTMVIDPVFDASGVITGGNIVGDFLDERLSYAPPYPSDAGSTSTVNNEYPGNEKVLVGPVVNGFDLSSWAQIPSGKHRIQFYNRTKNTVPFFQLPANARQNLLTDSTLVLADGEVYTMEVLQKDIVSTTNIARLYIRNEQFTKIPLADSLSYVNFYNLSAEGYAAAYNLNTPDLSSQNSNNGHVLRDTMNIFYTLYAPDSATSPQKDLVPGYQYIPLTTLIRSQASGAIAAYHAIPLFAGKDTTGGIYSHLWQELTFLAPGYTPWSMPFTFSTLYYGNYAVLDCNEARFATGTDIGVPNLNVLTPSGNYPERSFSAVSSVEWINNQVYLMTVQRQYPAPVNN
jgi:hypothetical protein